MAWSTDHASGDRWVADGLGVYDVVAPDFYGIEVPEGRAGEIHHRSIDDMIDALLALDGSSLDVARPPGEPPIHARVLRRTRRPAARPGR